MVNEQELAEMERDFYELVIKPLKPMGGVATITLPWHPEYCALYRGSSCTCGTEAIITHKPNQVA